MAKLMDFIFYFIFLLLGSCALVVLIVGDMCYIANVGDSRAIIVKY